MVPVLKMCNFCFASGKVQRSTIFSIVELFVLNFYTVTFLFFVMENVQLRRSARESCPPRQFPSHTFVPEAVACVLDEKGFDGFFPKALAKAQAKAQAKASAKVQAKFEDRDAFEDPDVFEALFNKFGFLN
jgi:hypothetical protein